MKIDLQLNTNEESNLFLRALLSNFEKEFGTYGWNYMPIKYPKKRKITFGILSVKKYQFLVSIYYKHRGVINQIEFYNTNENEILDEEKTLVTKIVEMTKSSYKHFKQEQLYFLVRTYGKMSSYHSERFDISTLGPIIKIKLVIDCFGDNDAEYIFQIKHVRFLDTLSIFTNLPFYSVSLNELKDNDKSDEYTKERFFDKTDFLEDYPVIGDTILLPEYSKDFLDKIMKYDKHIDDQKICKFFSAARHFHAGRKFDAQIFDIFAVDVNFEDDENSVDERLYPFLTNANMVCDNLYEMAVISYISALEVLSTIVFGDTSVRCEKCNQSIYSISKKVKDILIKYLGEECGKWIFEYYTSRSKFLHTGRLLKTPYTGKSIPQLNALNNSGVDPIFEVPLINLREYVSYIARCIIKEYLLE